MQYIAIAFSADEHQTQLQCSIISELAVAFGYRPMADTMLMYGDGMKTFADRKKITKVIFLNFPASKSLKMSSSGISDDLFDSFIENRSSIFEQFLSQLTMLCKEQIFYLIFGEEWYSYNYVKYYEGNLEKLLEILRLNQGWKTLLFNFEKDTYSSDSETPLVFKLVKNRE